VELVDRLAGGALRRHRWGRRLFVENRMRSDYVPENVGQDGDADRLLADVLVDMVLVRRLRYEVQYETYTPQL